MSLRLLLVGLPKSGTTTIHVALREAGLDSRHHRVEKGGEWLCEVLRRGFDETGDPLAYLPGVEAVTETTRTDRAPYWACLDYDLLKAVRRHHPEAWLVLNTRRPVDWVRSVNRWKDLRQRMQAMVGTASDEDLIDWQQAHYSRIRDLFITDCRFLELPIEAPNARDRLSQALNIELPWWGRAKANASESDLWS